MSPNAERNYFAVPKDLGYYIVDNRAFTQVKPFAVYERYYGGYRTGMTRQLRGSYATLDQAKRRVRYLERND